ncbi:chemotaxis protein CheW [Roseixanthobacter liquoris]|uniref:chemotaxis protein CheW n=1 Tax=Roseixanthobacter liquoris TaxID=3119921 RepID=UPI00372AB51D
MSQHVVIKQDVSPGGSQFVTVRIGPQLFGLPIEAVQEVFVPDHITHVPLCIPQIEGVLNLRGRIVTMVNMRRLLGLPDGGRASMAVGIEHKGESYGLIIDSMGEVMMLDHASREANPTNLDPQWAGLATGVHRLPSELLLVLDVELALARLTTDRAA